MALVIFQNIATTMMIFIIVGLVHQIYLMIKNQSNSNVSVWYYLWDFVMTFCWTIFFFSLPFSLYTAVTELVCAVLCVVVLVLWFVFRKEGD